MCLSRASRLQRSYDDIKSSSSSTITSLIGITGMESWLKISIILCMFGVLKEFRPSEPFITEYLINPPMNFTVEQVYQEIYPVSTYAYLVELIIVFLITDYLRYKPVIILDAISGLIVYILLIFGRSIQAMQAVEIIYGLFMAGEVAYYTYIYAKVDKEHFQEVSSHTRAAYLIGRAISGIVSQVVISAQLLNYYHLQFLTAGGLAVATIWALFLPPVKTSIYFHRNESTAAVSDTQERKQENVFVIMFVDLKHAVCNIYVLQLLIWSIISTAGFYQIASYVQVIWNVISKENAEQKQQMLWNGAVETLYTLLGAFGSFMVGKINLPWYKLSEIILAVNALVIAALLYVMSQTNTLWIAYLMYILFMILYHTCITIVNSEIAKNLKKDSYGLIFGVAMFFSLLVQTALTAIIVDKSGLALSPRAQFVVYGAYFNVLSGILFIKIILCAITRFCSGNKEDDVISVSGGEAL